MLLFFCLYVKQVVMMIMVDNLISIFYKEHVEHEQSYKHLDE